MKEEEIFSTPQEDNEDSLYGDLEGDEDSEFEDEDDEELFGDLEETEEPMQKSPTESSSISPEELPVQLTVEVGRVRMTAGELISLAPGNLLDLHVTPEQGVDLVVNGKKVGRGELIRMGDLLGVRILDL